MHLARKGLEDADVEVIGASGRDSRWEGVHSQAADGNLYQLASPHAVADNTAE